MIDFYFGPTPNARKVSIILEELKTEYRVIKVDILAGDQFRPEFLAVNPNNKMPAIVDHDGPDGRPISVWESGAILIYLAEKYRKFIPSDPRERVECFKWLMFQMAGVGPMGGQFAFFNFYAREKVPLAIERYQNEINRLMRVMEGHFAKNPYLAGTTYSIADMAVYPWWAMLRIYSECKRPALERWGAAMAERPAVVKGITMLAETLRPEVVQAGMTTKLSDETYGLLYGRQQYNPEAH